MAIATAGIIDQEWADLLKSWIAGDRYVDYYIETRNQGINLPVDSEDLQKIRSNFSYIDSITGLRFRETSNDAAADIYIAQVDGSFFAADADGDTLGVTSVENDGARDYFMILYSEQPYDGITIQHEIGHSVGLDHPYGDGFNALYTRADTIMSYNRNPAGTVKYQDSDKAALKYLWGEAGTNYDVVAPVTKPVPTTPQPPTTPNDALVASLVSGAWLQPSQVSSDSNVTYYLDRRGKYRFARFLQGKGSSGGISTPEASFIRQTFAQVDSAIPASVTEVGSAAQADIVIGSIVGNKKLTANAWQWDNGRTEGAWSDERGKKLTGYEKYAIAYAIGSTFGLDTAPGGYTSADTIMGYKNVGHYGLTVNDTAALGQIWAA